ncbi:unnamed protein product [Rhizophagus irregularis]|nr:unnamed protein product [Rhizophagus irregularis]CAB4479447.1 unnamed protein product [Rhizophagus irregularis]
MCEYEGSIDLYKKSCVYDPHLIWLLSGDAGRYLPPATRTNSIKSGACRRSIEVIKERTQNNFINYCLQMREKLAEVIHKHC